MERDRRLRQSQGRWVASISSPAQPLASHDTFNRFFSALNPEAFEEAFLSWVRAVSSLTEGEVVSIDGKTLRGSRDSGGKKAIHMVSAWANVNQLSLGQVKVNEKSNEITAIPKLLDVLALKGCIVMIDAMGCQRDIAEKIVSREADYILAVKGNQGHLEEDIERTVRFTKPDSYWKEEDFGHGRIESRHCFLYKDLSFIENAGQWKSLSAMVKIESTRYIKSTGKEEKETRFYITSSMSRAETIGKAVRSHWGIENQLHWQLDVSFSEDHSRKRD